MCPRRYKNWALNDFLILRRKRIKMSTKAKYAVRSLKNLLPDLSWTQIKRDSGAIFTVLALICTILGMGWYLRFHLKHAYVPVPRPQPEMHVFTLAFADTRCSMPVSPGIRDGSAA